MIQLPYAISVIPTTGKGRGEKIGIPTINFVTSPGIRLPFGIYAGRVLSQEIKYKAAIHFGPRPQFNETDPSLEAYLLDKILITQKDNLQLQFVKRVRDIRKFNSIKEMLEQIEKDIIQIKEILSYE